MHTVGSIFKCSLRRLTAYGIVKMQCFYVAGTSNECLLQRVVWLRDVSACGGLTVYLKPSWGVLLIALYRGGGRALPKRVHWNTQVGDSKYPLNRLEAGCLTEDCQKLA